ncbi:MAG TPA: hypothetical protein VKY26_04230 [Actinomycetota bacterium]|nr:hypothetical protein [Actinomycetota bacterium]
MFYIYARRHDVDPPWPNAVTFDQDLAERSGQDDKLSGAAVHRALDGPLSRHSPQSAVACMSAFVGPGALKVHDKGETSE